VDLEAAARRHGLCAPQLQLVVLAVLADRPTWQRRNGRVGLSNGQSWSRLTFTVARRTVRCDFLPHVIQGVVLGFQQGFGEVGAVHLERGSVGRDSTHTELCNSHSGSWRIEISLTSLNQVALNTVKPCAELESPGRSLAVVVCCAPAEDGLDSAKRTRCPWVAPHSCPLHRIRCTASRCSPSAGHQDSGAPAAASAALEAASQRVSPRAPWS
jgi:hypothetical protein